LSVRAVRCLHTIIGKALGDAERNCLVVVNVARRASPPTASAARAPESRVWTPAELAVFLAAVDDHQLATLFRVAAMTGVAPDNRP